MIFKRFPLQRKKPELCLFVNRKCVKAISSVKTKIFKTLFLNVPALFISFLGATSILHLPNLSHKTSKWRFRFKAPTQPWQYQVWPNIFLLKTILHRYHRKQNKATKPTILYYTYTILYSIILCYGIGLPTIPWQLYSTNIENIIIKITQSFTSFHMWHSPKLLHWSVRRSLRVLF